MKHNIFLFIIIILNLETSFGQDKYPIQQDSIYWQRNKNIEPIEIKAYFNHQALLGLTSSAQVLSSSTIESQSTSSLVTALNTVSGIRMEERSPGSYRLAMRGSLIRSPFGIRNVKVYLDEFPWTDAGGNTYLNLIDPTAIASIHLIKGPDGSLFGANSGGVIRILPKGFDVRKDEISITTTGGSFGLLQNQVSIQRNINKRYSFSIDPSWVRSDGYRENTYFDRKTIQTAQKWQYNAKNQFRFFAMYTDLGYQTPGGLTQQQMQENPRMARPATATTPGASEQKAAIYNKTWMAGMIHESQITQSLSHLISLYGSHTDLENPFITNYEFRKEKNAGLRTYLSLRNTIDKHWNYQVQLGYEGQLAWNQIDNYDNLQGTPKAPQAKDLLDNRQSNLFFRTQMVWNRVWTLEGSIGLNQGSIHYRQLFPDTNSVRNSKDLGVIWMPRLGMSYLIQEQFALRASISKGYSPPTLAEFRSSDLQINTDLRAESGLQYETGLRWEAPSKRLIADIAAYHYRMNNGIIRQLRENGAEYYVNAGEIKQFGLEGSFQVYLLPSSSNHSTAWIQSMIAQSSISYHHYRFGDYKVANQNFSGNRVTAVPDWTWTQTLSMTLLREFNFNISYRFSGKSPLNDANTVFSDQYHLVQLKASWSKPIFPTFQIRWKAGIDNALNERYSLGNDINAFGNRFFNPAPPRNYYVGVQLLF